ncbi:hypothetical protein A2U01_0002065 [Trifolium medium]|uniref:Uncharacterized protein n=1 Tax=Trifolium medium TaxID=97028 RepID=A0A392M1W2_9FABA|nr:hypothetical protein [Trifolium medium]
MEKPDAPSPTKKRTMPESKGKTSNSKRGKEYENTTTTENITTEKIKTHQQINSTQVSEQYSETTQKNIKHEIIYISSSHHTTTQGWNDQEDSADCDSTASTPKQPKDKATKKQYPATERRACKKKLCDNLGSTSAPPRLKEIKEWTAMLESKQYKKINKILFCQPEEQDDNDFQINYHPKSSMGYEFFDTGVPIPEATTKHESE